MEPSLVSRAALLLMHGPWADRPNTLATLHVVYERLLAAGVRGRDLIQVSDAIGTCQMELGQREAALATFRRGLEMRTDEFGATSLEAVVGVQSVAAILADKDPERALSLGWQTLTNLENERGTSDPATLWALSGLSLLYQNLGRFDEAARLSERHHEIWSTLPLEARRSQEVW